MKFEKGGKLYSYSVQKEGGEDVMYINYIGAPFVPSMADYPEVMEMTVDALIESPNVSRIVFVQQKNYNHDFRETAMLLELAQLYVFLIKQEVILSQNKLVTSEPQFFSRRYNEMFYFLYFLKRDPVSAYRELKRIMIEAKIFLDKLQFSQKTDQENYIRLLEKLFRLILKTELIKKAIPYLKYYKKGDREIYNRIFKPDTIPNFTFTRLVSDIPDEVEVMAQYKIAYGSYDESTVTVLRKKDEAKFIYHLEPPENSLSEEHNTLLNLARGVLIEHEPKAEEFIDT